jgi:hypothetical protein
MWSHPAIIGAHGEEVQSGLAPAVDVVAPEEVSLKEVEVELALLEVLVPEVGLEVVEVADDGCVGIGRAR